MKPARPRRLFACPCLTAFPVAEVVEAQDCSVPTAARTYGLLPDAIAFDTTNSDEVPEDGVDTAAALAPWTRTCGGTLPPVTIAPASDIASDTETWVVLRGRYSDFGTEGDAAREASACAGTYPDGRIIIFEDSTGDHCALDLAVLAHEIGHVFRLGHTWNHEACATASIMFPKPRHAEVKTADCDAVQRERERTELPPPPGGGGGDPGDGGGSNPGGGADPGGGGADRCTDHPDTPGCPGYCASNPDAPGCGTVTTSGVVCIPTPGVGIGWICIPLAPTPGGDGRDDNGWTISATATGSPGATYGFTLGGASQKVTVSLTGLSRDMDCRIHETLPP